MFNRNMESLTKKLLIGVIAFLAVLEAVALWLPGLPVISEVARNYGTKTFSLPFVMATLICHFWVNIFTKQWWNPLVWAVAIAAVIAVDFLTKWEPSNPAYIVIAGLINGLFWSQKKDK